MDIIKLAGSRKMVESSTKRKLKKPEMEKKRRERINRSLSYLKALLLHNIQRHGGTQTAKLDKADILEMTVNYITMIQHGQQVVTMATKHDYNDGYLACATKAMHYLSDFQNYRDQCLDQKADDSGQFGESSYNQQMIQITIPQAHTLTSNPKPLTFQQSRISKTRKFCSQDVESVLYKRNEKLDLSQDKSFAGDISSADIDISRSFNADESFEDEHEYCIRNGESKLWRPW